MMKAGGGRAKGKTFERLIANTLTQIFGHKFAATPASGGLRWKGIKNTRGDIVTDMENWPFCIECKKDESWSFDSLPLTEKNPLVKWWKQVCRDANAIDKEPVLIFTKNRKPIYVMRTHTAMMDNTGDSYLDFNFIVLTIGAKNPEIVRIEIWQKFLLNAEEEIEK